MLFCLAAAGPVFASVPPPARLMAPLVEGWAFRYGEEHTAAALAGTVADWPLVRLPHTWNAADGADGGDDYARGTGWYVRRFKVDPGWAGRRIYLQFDGASRVATVHLNGRKIGEHTGGFARFRFDLTGALDFAGENLLAVAVSNADDGTAPVTADFTFFGGLYRGVQLLAINPLHVDVMDHAADGIFVTPREVTAARAEFTVAVDVRNDSARTERAVVRVMVRDAAGAVVATQEATKVIDGSGAVRIEPVFTLENPHRWDGRKDPHQYCAEVTVSTDGRIRDVVRQRFGLRSFQVDADRGFFLNGVYLDLHGVSRHQDRAGKGWAISPEDEREDFALIEEIGATVIRVAHYPQSALWFDLADERGLVLWAEIPVVNEVPATTRYTDNARQQLRELIRQNYNRPAICFWGVGNETREVGETSGRAAVNGAASDRVIAELAELARAEDPTRLSIYASHHRAEDARNFHTDVLGFNKYFGWYGGTAEDLAAWLDGVHRRYPTLRFSMSEYGAGANILHHDLSGAKPVPDGAWHPEEYQAQLHEVQWLAMRARPYLWGKFIWNMFDFAVDIRDEGATPGMNDKGIVTYDRKTRKDAFYWYQAHWSAAPVLHLAGRRFTDRPAGPAEIKVYSNLPQAELFLDDKSLGAVAGDGTHLFRWQAELAAGPNRLEVRAANGATIITDRCTLNCRPAQKP